MSNESNATNRATVVNPLKAINASDQKRRLSSSSSVSGLLTPSSSSSISNNIYMMLPSAAIPSSQLATPKKSATSRNNPQLLEPLSADLYTTVNDLVETDVWKYSLRFLTRSLFLFCFNFCFLDVDQQIFLDFLTISILFFYNCFCPGHFASLYLKCIGFRYT